MTGRARDRVVAFLLRNATPIMFIAVFVFFGL